MEKILRKKFIVISSAVVFSVLTIVALVTNIFYYYDFNSDIDFLLELLAENDGTFSKNDNTNNQIMLTELPYSTRYFTVKFDDDDDIIGVDTSNIQMINTFEAKQLAELVLEYNTNSDYVNTIKYLITETDYGTLVIFIDASQELASFGTLMNTTIVIFIIVGILVFVSMFLFSKTAVRPIVDSYQKQQKFITNITHELKTPLAIIKTNTEVIEMIDGSSEWTQSIHHQISKYNELINYLINLSKLDENVADNLKTDFSISDVVSEVANSFEVIANSKRKNIALSIQKNLSFYGDEQTIRTLVSTLLDNAIKYSEANSTIKISLEEYKGKIIFIANNTAENLQARKYDELFDRFYRIENSRNSELGGYGIGLSLAKSIVKNHKGTIKAYSDDGLSLTIKIELPNAVKLLE